MHFPLFNIQFYKYKNCKIRFYGCLPETRDDVISAWGPPTANNSQYQQSLIVTQTIQTLLVRRDQRKL